MLDKVEAIVAEEEEFAIKIPDTETKKISTTVNLVDQNYIAPQPQAK